jgi:predicted glycosyl hydrolase (DUF1957 family)
VANQRAAAAKLERFIAFGQAKSDSQLLHRSAESAALPTLGCDHRLDEFSQVLSHVPIVSSFLPDVANLLRLQELLKSQTELAEKQAKQKALQQQLQRAKELSESFRQEQETRQQLQKSCC